MPTIHGEDAVLRVLDKESMSEKFRTLALDVVGFDEDDLRQFRRYIKEPYGMVLVTGPTGSRQDDDALRGAQRDQERRRQDHHHRRPGRVSAPRHHADPGEREEGADLRARPALDPASRPGQDHGGRNPRPETAQIAIQSALTGHLVFTTVHANNVVDVLGRFLNMGVEPYNFVSALNCILAQRLVRVICDSLQDDRCIIRHEVL